MRTDVDRASRLGIAIQPRLPTTVGAIRLRAAVGAAEHIIQASRRLGPQRPRKYVLGHGPASGIGRPDDGYPGPRAGGTLQVTIDALNGVTLTCISHPDKITMAEKQPSGFNALEDFDGFEFVFDRGCFARIVFKRDETRMTGHPFRYSLTLHAADGTRLLGFDNAHPAQRKSGNMWRRSAATDHWHRDRMDAGRTYAFESPPKLFRDFQSEVERVLLEMGIDPNPVQMRRSK